MDSRDGTGGAAVGDLIESELADEPYLDLEILVEPLAHLVLGSLDELADILCPKKLAFYKKSPTFDPEQADKFIQSFSLSGSQIPSI